MYAYINMIIYLLFIYFIVPLYMTPTIGCGQSLSRKARKRTIDHTHIAQTKLQNNS